jgi:tetratricopeptide (TPR) repeat protein
MEVCLMSLASIPDFPECARFGASDLPQLPHDAAWVRSTSIAEYCVSKLPDSPERSQLAGQLDAVGRKALEVPVSPLTRAGLYFNLQATRKALTDEQGQKEEANAMFQYIEAARAKLGTAEERSALDGLWVTAATSVGAVPHVLPYVEASARQFPKDPLPAVNLFNAYAALKRYDDALASLDRAISTTPPVRRAGLIATKAGLLQKKGDSAAAGRAWDEAIQLAEGLPPSSTASKLLVSLKTQREKATAAASAKVAKP